MTTPTCTALFGSSSVSGSSNTFTSVNFGTAASDRIIILFYNGTDPTAATIGGIAATINTTIGCFYAMVPTGTSGTVVTTSGGTNNLLFGFAMTGVNFTTIRVGSTGGTTSCTFTQDIPANSVVIATGYAADAGFTPYAGTEFFSGVSSKDYERTDLGLIGHQVYTSFSASQAISVQNTTPAASHCSLNIIIFGSSDLPAGSFTINTVGANFYRAPSAGTITMFGIGGGNSGTASAATGWAGGGAGASAQNVTTPLALSSGDFVYFSIGAGGLGSTTTTGNLGANTWCNINTNSAPTSNTTGIKAAAPAAAATTSGANPGGTTANSIGQSLFAGGAGGFNTSTSAVGGGSSAGSAAAGNAGTSTTAGSAVTGGGAGGAGAASTSVVGTAGSQPGGGGGCSRSASFASGAGGAGNLTLNFTASATSFTESCTGTATSAGTAVGLKAVTQSKTGTAASSGTVVDKKAVSQTKTGTATSANSVTGKKAVSEAPINGTTTATGNDGVPPAFSQSPSNNVASAGTCVGKRGSAQVITRQQNTGCTIVGKKGSAQSPVGTVVIISSDVLTNQFPTGTVVSNGVVPGRKAVVQLGQGPPLVAGNVGTVIARNIVINQRVHGQLRPPQRIRGQIL